MSGSTVNVAALLSGKADCDSSASSSSSPLSSSISNVASLVNELPQGMAAGGSGDMAVTSMSSMAGTGVASPVPFWSQPEAQGERPGPRAAHSCDVIGGNKLFVFGGWNGKKALNDMYILDTVRMEWICAKTKNPPDERNNHTTAVVGYKLFAHGGHDGNKWLADLYMLDTEPSREGRYHDLVWEKTCMSGTAPSARACHTLTRVHEKLFMFGGYDGNKCFNDIDILDLGTKSWIQPKVQGTIPQARNAHSMTVIESKLYLFGGHSGNKHLTDLHVFDTSLLAWTQPTVEGSAPPGLRGHTANLIGDKIFLFGGYDGKGRSNDLYILDTKESKWIHPPESENAPAGRQRHSASLIGPRKLFVFGGFDGSKWLNDLYVFDVGRLEEGALASRLVVNLIDNLHKLVNSPKFSDITLVVDGQEIPAHKCILASQCPYFDKMFAGQMLESKASRVVIPHWSHRAFVAMLEFLYSGRMTEDSPTVVCEVLGIADQYTLDGLKSLCERMLIHSVDCSNVCRLVRDAHVYQAPELKKFCYDYIRKYPDTVTNSSEFEKLSESPALLVELVKLSLVGQQTKDG